ncbi:hypothetical protein FNW02_12650 [Komarekiella sp. 'clone 1']|uniref:Uncharacterized protein n=1 Tax=Komarekiella delphini-convector SJRDD-AB1 TaxID=2593771 RepID=A0AA40SX63_9NOST|nr:hypothetical protein [Komarekiella delphini-convector]MBD6616657.1 hypothetical protein [Komarekiella delphini-convector SJRDD-AB1]
MYLPYVFTGWLLAVYSAPLLLWIGAGAVAVVVSAARTLTVAIVAAGTMVVAVAGTVVMAIATYKLRESFNPFHAFLILTITSGLGLAMGWLTHLIFR